DRLDDLGHGHEFALAADGHQRAVWPVLDDNLTNAERAHAVDGRVRARITPQYCFVVVSGQCDVYALEGFEIDSARAAEVAFPAVGTEIPVERDLGALLPCKLDGSKKTSETGIRIKGQCDTGEVDHSCGQHVIGNSAPIGQFEELACR